MTIEKLLCDLFVLLVLIGAAAYIIESTKYLDERKQK
jgi:hypothetical protein